MQLGDTTMESRDEQQRQIRKLMEQYQIAVRDGKIRHNQVLDEQIRRQVRRSQEREGMERW
jgi:hypothetical protein